MTKIILSTLTLFTFYSCATRAASDYELNRRLGVPTPEEKKEKQPISGKEFRTNSVIAPQPLMPARVPAVVERIWSFDRKIGNYQQQGTWIWAEVEPPKWLSDVDPGGGKILSR